MDRTIIVLLRAPLATWRLGEVEAILRPVASDVATSRKGHNWTFVVCHSSETHESGVRQPRVFTLELVGTEAQGALWGDILLEHNLLFEDAPQAFLISAPTTDPRDRAICRQMAQRLATQFHELAPLPLD